MRSRIVNFRDRFCRDTRRPAIALCAAVIVLAACSCDRYPDSYAPPEQRPNFEDAARWQRIVHMTDVDATDHFVADIMDPLAANWRWTGRRPTVHLTVPAGARLKYHVEFVIPPETFQSTGPVNVTFLIEGRALDVKHYSATGSYQFEKDVPPEWISRGGDIRVGADIDKVLTTNGRTYGFLLIAMGLKRN